MKRTFIFTIITFTLCAACKQTPTTQIRDDFKRFYDQYHVEGTFVLFDQSNQKFIIYNHQKVNEPFIPASTFKICNSLIGLETGVIQDENFIIPWDSVIRSNEQWNHDHDLKTAFENSTVWYYQELARRVGGKQMKYWLDTINYGNADTSGGIDKFWLDGGLRITPMQQIDFLKRLHDDKLPFSKRTLDIVKQIMIAKDTANYVLRAKTGWSQANNINLGWYIGYYETKDNTYYFANCIQTTDFENKEFAISRKEIVYSIFEELQIIKKY